MLDGTDDVEIVAEAANGREVLEKLESSVPEVLFMNVKMPEMVSVEVNGTIVPRPEFDATSLAENDKIEFLYFMGGGQCR
ncbi:hypothetical protein LCGC14_2070200 [marine sediment metagenome]|uniref:Response regulatory domain-containing protein n=1 Tax=marine sediment metagenome TaxID=412755 RepID=A0A0F9F611_9ZZZZ